MFSQIEFWLAGLGLWSYVVAPLVMTFVAVLPIPAEAPAMANGMLFGPVVGSLITWIGAMAGAWISYEVARAWGRAAAERMVSKAGLDRVDQLVEGAGWWGLLLLRFIPVVAFTALNWGSGMCLIPGGASCGPRRSESHPERSSSPRRGRGSRRCTADPRRLPWVSQSR